MHVAPGVVLHTDTIGESNFTLWALTKLPEGDVMAVEGVDLDSFCVLELGEEIELAGTLFWADWLPLSLKDEPPPTVGVLELGVIFMVLSL